MNTSEKISVFLEKFPLLTPTVQTLDTHAIPWMISGSGCLFLLGNDRIPDDVDIFLQNEDHDRADRLFGIESYFYTSATEKVRNSNPENNHAIQLTSDLRISIDNHVYDLSVTDSVLEKRKKIENSGITLWLLPPEDVLLVKALLQRGTDVGKHDIEDIQNFRSIYPLDTTYLEQRISMLDAAERIGTIFT